MLNSPIIIAAIILAIAITWRLWAWLFVLIGACIAWLGASLLLGALNLFEKISGGQLKKWQMRRIHKSMKKVLDSRRK